MVTGSRDWTERSIIRMALAEFAGRGPVTLVHGGARGADTGAETVAIAYGFGIEVHPADWKKHGKRAGILRNLAMLDSGVDHVVAFHMDGSRGTAHAVGEALRRGVPVTRFVVRDGDYTTLAIERHGSPAFHRDGV